MNPLNKRRSRRLRKKMHIGEFQEMGFHFHTELKSPLTRVAEEFLVNRFLSEIVEPRSLAFGGWVTGGFLAYNGRGSATEADREEVGAWLTRQPEIAAVKIGDLIDAWHSMLISNN